MTSPTTDRRQGLVGNTSVKAPVTVLAAGNLTLSGQQTIDGVAVLAINSAGVPDRVLCIGQTNPVDNGIWDVSTASWTRSVDANGNYDLTQGTVVLVTSGSAGNAGAFWSLTTSGAITVGTTALTWARSFAASVTTQAVALDSIAALRAQPKTGSPRALVAGNAAVGDGGGGEYYYDATDTTSTDNGGSIIVASDGGRWKLLTQGKNSAQMFPAAGAIVQRFGDRLFVGDASKHSGENVASQPDWLTTYVLAKGRAFAFQQVTQQAVLTANNASSDNAFLAGARTLPFSGAGNAIGVLGVGVNNNTLSTINAYGGYYEGYRDTAALGGAYGVEIDTINYASVIDIDPYQQLAAQTIGLQLAAGGAYAAAGQFASSAAINIRNNGSSYERGIIFGSNAISGATGSTGTGTAIAFGIGHIVQWFGAAGVGTSGLVGTGTTAAGGTLQNFGEGFINWTNASSTKLVLQLVQTSSSVNYLSLNASLTTVGPAVLAAGDDTNIDLRLVPKGTGSVSFGSYTAGAVAQAGYISVKDSGGTVRRLLVG